MGLGLSGFGLANIIPLVYGAAGNLNPKEPGTAIAGVATIGYLGFLIGPPMVGALADAFSLRVSYLVIAVFLATIVYSGKKLPE
jgi:MFS family permease